ncbi:aldehyde oxidase GLOX-like [Silene latifolia]|uniref:aldehyde oxidase GLOX-like n=1 Tax=Silene latifolia TaxID=37657 RepID=UPI003D77B7A2
MFHILHLFLFNILILSQNTIAKGVKTGQWQLLQKTIGISAMHMQLLHNDRVIMYDRTDFGPSNLTLGSSQCPIRYDKTDCTAHSVEYNVLSNTYRPLNIISDTWCSSGTTLIDGCLLQSGGWQAGERVFRTFTPCPTCDWEELSDKLFQRRWYASNHILPNGKIIIIGGRDQFNYEFFPTTNIFKLPFLAETYDQGVENNLYPFVFLNVDGNLFIFANNRAILLDYNANKVVRSYPSIPGGEPRNYPSTGSAVLLPLVNLELGVKVDAQVLVCGGTPNNSYWSAKKKQFIPALDTCARIRINDPNPVWVMEKMPMRRTMGDMILLPNGKVIIINGAGSGCAGWEYGRDPVLTPVVYDPHEPVGSRFHVMAASIIPRMYHSSAVLLRDGRILVGGSNPHEYYNFTNVLFPTELSLEAYLPPYLSSRKSGIRPTVTVPTQYTNITYGKNVTVNFSISMKIKLDTIKITMIRPAFNTHSFSMSQRLLVLTRTKIITPVGPGQFQVNVTTPGSRNLAPPGFYMLFVVHRDVPSPGVWVRLL